MSGYWSKSLFFRKGVGHFKHKFQGEWGIAHRRLLASLNSVVCLILGLAISVGHRLVTDGRTDGQTQ